MTSCSSSSSSVSDELMRLYYDLEDHFGPQNWWPGETPWEVVVGAVLTQNTNWGNVEKAINNLKSHRVLELDQLIVLEPDQLAQLIRPAGYFNVKSRRLVNVADWWRRHAQWASDQNVDLVEIRENLLTVHGVGEETADSILLYACNRPTFVVDAYTRKFLSRHQMIASSASYGDIKSFFESNLPADLDIYQEYHALIVMLGKHYCRPTPRCSDCPLQWHLARV